MECDKKCRVRTELVQYLENCAEWGIDDDSKFANALYDVVGVVEDICSFIEKHGDIALQCGSEWLYQSDKGQVDALKLVGNILDSLSEYAEEDED